jgi:hypothetical protein
MSFETLNKAQLDDAAKQFGIDWTKTDPKKNEMIKDLEEEGITWKMYKQANPDPEPEEEDEEPEQEEDDTTESAVVAEVTGDEDTAEKKFSPRARQPVLVKMTRANPSYEVRGYNFTKRHPFLPVSPDDAEYLVNSLGGFSIATPKEVDEFYS